MIDDPIHAAIHEHRSALAWLNAAVIAESRGKDRFFKAQEAAAQRLLSTRAKTTAGALALIEYVLEIDATDQVWLAPWSPDREDRREFGNDLLRSVARTLKSAQ